MLQSWFPDVIDNSIPSPTNSPSLPDSQSLRGNSGGGGERHVDSLVRWLMCSRVIFYNAWAAKEGENMMHKEFTRGHDVCYHIRAMNLQGRVWLEVECSEFVTQMSLGAIFEKESQWSIWKVVMKPVRNWDLLGLVWSLLWSWGLNLWRKWNFFTLLFPGYSRQPEWSCCFGFMISWFACRAECRWK